MPTNLVVCESPWIDGARRIAPYSVRHFVEGLADLHGARLIYRTFTTVRELQDLLAYETIDQPRQRNIVYIACHGNGGRITIGRRDVRANLGAIARWLHQGVEGIWLGTCDVAAGGGVSAFLRDGGARWAGGYACGVDWEPSLLIDLAVLERVLAAGRLNGSDSVVRVIAKALSSFDPDWIVGVDRHDVQTPLRAAVRLMARDYGRPGRDYTSALKQRLRWTANGANAREGA